jgi:Zn-dependent metalloprotease
MAIHKCHCLFIPPHVLDHLARNKRKDVRDSTRLTIQQSQLSRTRRSTKLVSMDRFAPAAPAGEGARIVYDSEKTWQQRVREVRTENQDPTGEKSVDSVFDFIGLVRTFYRELNRNSYDDAGADIIMNVHFGTKYNNAFWDGDELTFGDGDGVIFTDFTQSLDVVAHEFAHGVTQFTADLEYNSQSGALNESFSDVFGSAITQYVNGEDAGTADWLIGDEIMGPDLYGESLRSMKAPGTAYDNDIMGKDPQPDHMNNYYTGSDDNQGVHINSGIPSRAFYLVATTIGTQEAAKIWYHALQNLWATAKFNDAVHVIAESARILTRDGQVVPKGSTQAVRSAFKAVGLPA